MRSLTFLFVLALLSACNTVAGTGRSRIMPMMGLEEQKSLGAQAYGESLAGAKIITSGKDYEMVQRVGRRLIASQALNELFPEQAKAFDWEFKLVDDPETLNAWVLPGGKSAVYTGILKVTQDEDGLAAVMGHEIAHAVAEHGAERMSQQVGLQAILAGGSLALGDMDPEDQALIMGAAGLGAQYGVLLPFSRTHETESDELGVYFAASAGYDPEAAIRLWERMAQLSTGAPSELMSTHPSHSTRIEDLRAVMPKAKEWGRKAGHPMN